MKKVLSLIALVLGIGAFSSLYAQNSTTLRFTGQGRQGAYVQLSSVEVKNLTRGWEETLVYPDTILMLGNVGLEDHVSILRFALSQNMPNPFRGSTDFSLQMPEADKVSISVFDINGKKITDLTQDLTEGIHIFRVILNTPQTYLVTAKTEHHSATIKIINQGSEAYNRVVYLGMGSGSITYEMGGNKNLTTNHDFEPGDLMCYVGKYIANGVEYTSDTVLQPQYQSQDFQLLFQCVPLNVNMFSATTCDAFTWNGQTYTQTGTYTQTFQGTDGCDSVVTLNLTVNQPVIHNFAVTSCGNYIWNGQTYTQSGTYTQTFQGANGCDSVVTLNLTIHQPTSSELMVTTCGSFTWNGQTLTQSGTYSQTLQDVNGCDSVATLHLTITPPVTNSIAASACGSYVWNDQTYTQSGTYTQTLQTVSGCDSVVTLNLTVGVTSLPTLSAVQVYGVSAHAANVTASVLSDGCSPVVSQGFCWGTQPDPVVSGSHADCPVGMATFFSALSGLEAGQTYYVRAYATNALGTAYSPSATFTTDSYLSFALLVDTPCTSGSTASSHSMDMLEHCVGRDSVRLSIGNYEYGIVQWQVSHDTVVWTNIKDANDTFYVFYPEESGYYRARMTYNLCPSEYSQTIHLHLIPRADAGRDRVLNADYTAQLFGNEFEDATGLWTVLSGDSAVIDDPTDPYALFQGPDSLYVLTWTLTNSCGTSTDTVTLRFIHTVFADHIVVVDTTDLILSDSAEMANGLYRIVFNYPVPTIVDSTILVGIPNGGFLRKVVSFEQQGDTAVMYTQQGTLTDIIKEGAFSLNANTLNLGGDTSAKSIKQPEKFKMLDHQPTRAELSENTDIFNGKMWLYDYPSEYTGPDDGKSGLFQFPISFSAFGDSIVINPSISISDLSVSFPQYDPEFDIYVLNGEIHAYYLYQLRMPMSFTLNVKGSISSPSSLYSESVTLGKFTKRFIFPIGAVPVEVAAKVSLDCDIDLEATLTGQHSWGVSGELVVGVGVSYDDGVASLITPKTFQNFTCVNLGGNVNGSMEFSISVGPNISMKVYEVVGPYAKIGPKISAKYCQSFTEPNNFTTEFRSGIPWKIGIDMKVLKRKVFDVKFDGTFLKVVKPNPASIEKCVVPVQDYDKGNGVYHPVSFKVLGGPLGDFLGGYKVRIHSTSGNIEGSNQLGQLSNNWNRMVIDTTVMPNDTIDIYWKPSGTSPSIIEVELKDCEGEDIKGSPLFYYAIAGDNPCLQSDLQLSEVNNKLRATGGRPWVSTGYSLYRYSSDGMNYSFSSPTVSYGHLYYAVDSNNCIAVYHKPGLECNLALNYSLNGNLVGIKIENGVGPYRCFVDGNTAPLVVSVLPAVAFQLPNGDHTIRVSDGNGCMNTIQLTVNDGKCAPSVYLNKAYNTTNSVWDTVQAIVVDDGNADVEERGVFWGVTKGTMYMNKIVAPLGDGVGAYLSAIPANIAQNPYFVCAYAKNNRGTGYSDTVLISDHGYSAVVQTDSVFNITANSASGAGTVLSNGTSDDLVVFRGICWNTAGDPTPDDNYTQDEGQGIGSFVNTLTGLTPNTTYYARAYAINFGSNDPAYGDVVTFTTLGGSGSQDGQPCPGTPTVTDYDGNVYNTVQIGQQCWMKENLRTTHYADGVVIPAGGGNTSSTDPYFYDYSSSGIALTQRGYLYNWPAVTHSTTSSTSTTSNVQGICPTGWHVPSSEEWDELEDYVRNQSQYVCGNNKIAKALASSEGWDSFSCDCCPGDQSVMANNATGFSAVPAGYCDKIAELEFLHAGRLTVFWCFDEDGPFSAYNRYMSVHNDYVSVIGYFLSNGFSVRCLRDDTSGSSSASLPTVTTNSISNITATSATCGGNVVLEGDATVTARGVCWSTSHNPTISDNHTSDGSGTGSFTSSITGLTSGTTYYVRAYATNSVGTAYGSEVSLTTAVFTPTEFTCGISTVTDHEGNEYHTVSIGSQCWTRENMRCVTSPSTGTYLIPATEADYTWTGKQARWYNNDSATYAPMNYGLLYNWNAAVDTFNVTYGETSVDTNGTHAFSVMFNGHRRGICPEGWHIPTDAEWTVLTNYINSQNQYSCVVDNSVSVENDLAEGWLNNYVVNALASEEWLNNLVDCSPSINNAFGFNALPVGFYTYEDDEQGDISYYFVEPNFMTLFLTASQQSSEAAWSRHLYSYGMFRDSMPKIVAGSVRCVYNSDTFNSVSLPTVTTSAVTIQSESSVGCGGEVLSDGGAAVIARGICWSTSPNPTVSDNHTNDGCGIGAFTSSITGVSGVSRIYVRAYATNSVGTVYGERMSFIMKSCPGNATVTDIDGNIYNTVPIGSQCWMRENLRTTRYADGTAINFGGIPDSTDNPNSDIEPYYYDYSNSGILSDARGYLYNWPAVMHGAVSGSSNPSSVGGICPTGWHLPSDAEWLQLTDYLSDQTEYVCGNETGNIAKALASPAWWASSYLDCSVGNEDGENNASGFDAVPAGAAVWDFTGVFSSAGTTASFWSSTESGDNNEVITRVMHWFSLYMYSSHSDKSKGLSVRCLRDENNTGGGTAVVDEKSCFGTPTVTDHEGNVYATVQIGNQCWMRDNLRTTTSPSTGTYLIPASNTGYTYTGKQARWYDNDSATYAPMNYGLLYNWNAAVDTFNTAYGETSVNTDNNNAVSVNFTGHRRGICPAGWHLPSDAEWTQLIVFVSSHPEYTCGAETYNIAKALASTEGWNGSTNSCAIGNDQTMNNPTGFSIVPAGYNHGSSFYGFGSYADFWSSTEYSSSNAYSRNYGYNYAFVSSSYSYKCYSYSVRCLRDQ